ncbi:MAG: twin-arginine translocase subunit TatC [Candidatus Omnitrophica bacterium]|nr:twin-arginine translocase subunit TatC [Candidatus Omnitrophota bacterium]
MREKKERVNSLSFWEHLEELRRRILFVLFVWILAGACFYLYSDKILKFLFAPLVPFQPRPVFTRPLEPFMVTFGVSCFAGCLVALPLLIVEIWLFVAPGLNKEEQKISRLIIPGLVIFSYAGMAFGFFLLVPVALKVLLGFSRGIMMPFLSAGSYLGFVAVITLGLGVVFNLPVVLGAMGGLGIVQPATLAKNRRLALVGALVLAAIITPTTDVVTQLMLAAPLVVLYEVGIIFSKIFSKQ